MNENKSVFVTIVVLDMQFPCMFPNLPPLAKFKGTVTYLEGMAAVVFLYTVTDLAHVLVSSCFVHETFLKLPSFCLNNLANMIKINLLWAMVLSLSSKIKEKLLIFELKGKTIAQSKFKESYQSSRASLKTTLSNLVLFISRKADLARR